MQLSSVTPRRGLVVLTAGTMVATLGIAVTHQADAADRCRSAVTAMKQVARHRFAGQGITKTYHAAIDYPGAGGWVDQSANAIYTVFPTAAVPALLNSQIGDRLETGKQVRAQQPQAVGAINGDFFLYPKIRGKDVEIPRGPMVKDGQIIRADRKRLRVVGVDSGGQPFGGLMSVRGKVQIGTGPAVKVAGVNWSNLQNSGATVYTNSWSSLAASPRPAGVVEWVIDDNNKIQRSPDFHSEPRALGRHRGCRYSGDCVPTEVRSRWLNGHDRSQGQGCYAPEHEHRCRPDDGRGPRRTTR